jgi:hypothetical protein
MPLLARNLEHARCTTTEDWSGGHGVKKITLALCDNICVWYSRIDNKYASILYVVRVCCSPIIHFKILMHLENWSAVILAGAPNYRIIQDLWH